MRRSLERGNLITIKVRELLTPQRHGEKKSYFLNLSMERLKSKAGTAMPEDERARTRDGKVTKRMRVRTS